jgi:hypothetical protein
MSTVLVTAIFDWKLGYLLFHHPTSALLSQALRSG